MPNTITRGFHPGELAVQRRAGVGSDAARLEGMLAPAHMSGGAAKFLAQREFAVLTGRDRTGRLWSSPLLGPEGFLDAGATTLDVHATPAEGDPLHDLPIGQPVGLIAVEFAIRRRFRVNGTLAAAGRQGLSIAAEQAFGNCPAYIQQRDLVIAGDSPRPAGDPVQADTLSAEDKHVITSADTFFLGTAHPARGSDTSHKGGLPGFVRVDGPDLWWPDYAGNNMFNSLGNVAINPEAALLFIDFTTGGTVHLSGTAELEWTEIGAPGDDDGTGRRVRFHPERVVSTGGLPVHAYEAEPSPHNPRLR